MKIRTSIVCLPVRHIEKTLVFYKDALGFSEANIDEGIILVELPNLSLFLMDKGAFEAYSKKAGRAAHLPDDRVGLIISCAMESQEEVDSILGVVSKYGGTAHGQAANDEATGGYIGYFTDPDGYLWELVHSTRG